ncbi:MAG TPA: 4'-phosphopantetheinyl transferase superfamily protein [Solirubrobacteraceae bacterium]|nr:4'-phosphopantetheinyl transferase superfamily protein [Solirubrobacteraceae bacterium]
MSARTQPASALARHRLGDGAVQVWVADLDAIAEEPSDLLSDEEKERARRFVRERDRQRWARARGLLRILLGQYLHSDPGALRLATGARGKPELLGDTQELCFNLAHSAGLALYALTSGQAVGVDVEAAGRRIDALAVAERAFGSAAARRLGNLDPGTREREFLRAWVKHEAALKCLGSGLGGSETDAHGRRPWVAELDLGPRAAAAVAVMGEPTEVSCLEWRLTSSGRVAAIP